MRATSASLNTSRFALNASNSAFVWPALKMASNLALSQLTSQIQTAKPITLAPMVEAPAAAAPAAPAVLPPPAKLEPPKTVTPIHRRFFRGQPVD